MKENVLTLLHCPDCGAKLDFAGGERRDGEVEAGRLSCPSCSATFPVTGGVPVLLPAHQSQGTSQSRESFSAKWDRVPHIYDEKTFGTEHQRQWYLTRYRWGAEDRFRDFLRSKSSILDAGCGLGRDVRWYATLRPGGTVIGADLSEAVHHARAKSRDLPNASVIQADLNKLPFALESFDFVASDQVLSNVEDPRGSIARLWSHVKPGGHFAFYVYKKKCPIREFSDDFLRAKIVPMTPDAAWEACANVTRLGRALSDLRVEFEVPCDVPELGIKAGRQDLQRFIYYNVLKCFWNDRMSFDENNLVNLDWYHPAFTYRYAPEEVEAWTRELGMKVLVLDAEDLSGISVLVEKPGPAR